MITFLTFSWLAFAADIELPVPSVRAKSGDALTFTEPCTAANLPQGQEGVEFSLSGPTGRVLIGAPWTGVRVTKGNDVYQLQVVHRRDEDPIALVKSGKFTTTGP